MIRASTETRTGLPILITLVSVLSATLFIAVKPAPPFAAISAQDAYKAVLAAVGACLFRDNNDSRIFILACDNKMAASPRLVGTLPYFRELVMKKDLWPRAKEFFHAALERPLETRRAFQPTAFFEIRAGDTLCLRRRESTDRHCLF
jgi:hypothetical protein